MILGWGPRRRPAPQFNGLAHLPLAVSNGDSGERSFLCDEEDWYDHF